MSEFGVLSDSGQRIDVLDPNPNEVVIGDVIRALSLERRFPATGIRYSVAQHSVVVGRIVAGWLSLKPNPWVRKHGQIIDRVMETVAPDLAKLGAIADKKERARINLLVHRAAVLHDASEYVLRDMARDVKRALRNFEGAGYDVLEGNLMTAISKTVGLSELWSSEMSTAAQNIVKRADDEALAAEVCVLWPEDLRAGFNTDEPMHYSLAFVREAAGWNPEETQRAMALELLESAFATWGYCDRIGTVWPTF